MYSTVSLGRPVAETAPKLLKCHRRNKGRRLNRVDVTKLSSKRSSSRSMLDFSEPGYAWRHSMSAPHNQPTTPDPAFDPSDPAMARRLERLALTHQEEQWTERYLLLSAPRRSRAGDSSRGIRGHQPVRPRPRRTAGFPPVRRGSKPAPSVSITSPWNICSAALCATT